MKSWNSLRHLLVVLAFLLSFSAGGQAGPSLSSGEPQTKAAVEQKVEQFLKESGYSYRKASDSVWVIERQGKALTNMKIIIASDAGFVLAGVIVAKKAQLRVTSDLSFKLLKLAHAIDYVKVGFDDDEDLFVREEVRARLFDLQSFKNLIEDVSGAADRAYTEVKPFLVAP